MTTEPADPLEGLTEGERFHALVHVDLSTTDGNVIRGFALALAAERRENARLREALESIATAQTSFFLVEDLLSASGTAKSLVNLAKAALAGEVKAKP